MTKVTCEVLCFCILILGMTWCAADRITAPLDLKPVVMLPADIVLQVPASAVTEE